MPDSSVQGEGFIVRLLRLLQLFIDEKSMWGVREMARALDLPHTTTHRLLNSLQAEGIVQQDPISKKYSIGSELFRMSLKVAARLEMEQLARPEMELLSRKTGASVYLAMYVPAKYQLVLVSSVQPNKPLRLEPNLYEYLPLFCGASGRSILAFLSEDKIDFILKDNIPSITTNTITDHDELRNSLVTVRQKGYAISLGERVPDAVSIAAPFWDMNQTILGSIVLCLPRWHFSSEQELDYAQALLRASDAVTYLMGGKKGTLTKTNLQISRGDAM